MKLLVIGGGPAGYEAAAEARKRGLDVTLVTEGPLGGTCLNEGCIPTKALCAKAYDGVEPDPAAIDNLRAGIAQILKGVEIIQGHARFIDPHTVEVGGKEIGADVILIATGSDSAVLPIPGAEYALTSRQMLDLNSVPQRLTVIGGGVIGLEFASIYAALGSCVTVLEYCPQILPHFDADIAKRLKAALVRRGINIITSAQVREIQEDGVVTYSKDGGDESLLSDVVLMATGRTPRVDGLCLENAGVRYSRKGIEVDAKMRTSAEGIYAAGDVTGGIMLAHTATFQALAAIDTICGELCTTDFSINPAVVFTQPELATVGKTEEDLKAAQVPYKALKGSFRANGKAVVSGQGDGVCKILVGEDGSILGAHILGAHASDLIHEVTVMMAAGMKAGQARSVIHAHPSLSEIILNTLRQL